MTDAERRRFEPPESESGAPFWAATRERRFVLPWCRACDAAHWYPREVCPHCGSLDLEWRPATGLGTVHACSLMPRPAMPMLADRVPYVVAIVSLDEGPRMMTNVVDCAPESVVVGMRVKVAWEPLSDGRHLAVFAPGG